MKILFTKTDLDKKQISSFFGHVHECSFLDVIQTEFRKTTPTGLANNALIFTSVNGVRGFLKNGYSTSSKNHIFCVGEKAAKLLQQNGYQIQETEKNAASLAEKLLQEYADLEYLHFCGDKALDTLAEKLRQKQIKYQRITVYETRLLNPVIGDKYDALVFFSPSGVRSFADRNSFEGAKLFSIGATTEKEIRNFTSEHVITSTENTLEDLLRLIKENL